MKEVSPELLNQIAEYLKKRERGEKSLLSFFYKEVFERELKQCGGCIEEGLTHLKSFINNKTKPVMENFIWKGSDKANCIIRLHGQMIDINKNTCTDLLAGAIEFNSAYSHLVQRIKPSVEKKTEQVKEVSKTLEVTILTSKEVKKEEPVVKKKAGRPKSK
jgi:hypothetical protein